MTEISILFENREVVVVDKPVGISIHNADASESSSDLIEILCRQFNLSTLFPVHRLDKDTSGVQILARSSEAAATWSQEFQRDQVVKIYEGVTRGALKVPDVIWRMPITDRAEGRNNPAGVSGNRVNAETRVRVLKSNRYFSHCQFQLVTGRQHQIRKHCAMQKHPLVGDRRYGEPSYNLRMSDIYKTDRMFLHSNRVEIRGHVFESEIPPEFQTLFFEK